MVAGTVRGKLTTSNGSGSARLWQTSFRERGRRTFASIVSVRARHSPTTSWANALARQPVPDPPTPAVIPAGLLPPTPTRNDGVGECSSLRWRSSCSGSCRPTGPTSRPDARLTRPSARSPHLPGPHICQVPTSARSPPDQRIEHEFESGSATLRSPTGPLSAWVGRAGAATRRNLGDNNGQQGITNLEVSSCFAALGRGIVKSCGSALWDDHAAAS
jgi:hypothetical protein